MINDVAAFHREANEAWQIYPRPEGWEREYSIKWAVQEYLYETIGWSSFMYCDLRVIEVDEEIEKGDHAEAPAGYAMIAYALGFQHEEQRWSTAREHEFWRWWLLESIPESWHLAQM